MSKLEDLPPDQSATLSLLLRSRMSYAEVATRLGIPERAVHDRAHAALAVLAPSKARALTPERRAELSDYLLGQRAGMGERLATRAYLEQSPDARAWAQALVGELSPLAGDALPELPAGAGDARGAASERDRGEPARQSAGVGAGAGAGESAAASVATAAGERAGVAPAAAAGESATQRPSRSLPRPPSSRLGGALLLGALVAVVVVAVVLIANSGGSSHKSGTSAAAATSGTTAERAKEDKRITLRPVDPASKAIGVAEVLSEGSKYAIYLAAENLPPSHGFFYAVWLYNSPTSFQALSRAPAVGADGRLQGGALLPANAGSFKHMLLTRETNSRPTRPGPTVLSGEFALH